MAQRDPHVLTHDVRAGDPYTPILRASRDEVGDLAAAFEAMRQGIREQTAKADRLAYWDELTGLPEAPVIVDLRNVYDPAEVRAKLKLEKRAPLPK